MDDLSAVLDAVRLRGQMYCRLEARAPWAMCAPPSPVATFHGVVRGDAVLQIAGEDDVPLEGGDLAVICHGSGHTIGDLPGRAATPIGEILDGAPSRSIRCGGRGRQTVIVCGGFSVKRDGPPLLALMPPILHVRGNPRVAHLVLLLASEGSAPMRGTDALVARLTEALFVEVAREWVARSDGKKGTPVAALADRRIATALAAIHARPEKQWTVAALAREVGMSRSSFALTFTQLVGAAPLAYLTEWRLYAAKVRLRESSDGMVQIAEQVGYLSEASLSKAFRRHFGLPPGAWRREARRPAATEIATRPPLRALR